MKLFGLVDGELKDLKAEIELLRGYRDEAEADAAVARLLADRLRLTDAEREAIDGIISDFSEIADFNEERCYPVYASKARRRAAILRGLLERLRGER